MCPKVCPLLCCAKISLTKASEPLVFLLKPHFFMEKTKTETRYELSACKIRFFSQG